MEPFARPSRGVPLLGLAISKKPSSDSSPAAPHDQTEPTVIDEEMQARDRILANPDTMQKAAELMGKDAWLPLTWQQREECVQALPADSPLVEAASQPSQHSLQACEEPVNAPPSALPSVSSARPLSAAPPATPPVSHHDAAETLLEEVPVAVAVAVEPAALTPHKKRAKKKTSVSKKSSVSKKAAAEKKRAEADLVRLREQHQARLDKEVPKSVLKAIVARHTPVEYIQLVEAHSQQQRKRRKRVVVIDPKQMTLAHPQTGSNLRQISLEKLAGIDYQDKSFGRSVVMRFDGEADAAFVQEDHPDSLQGVGNDELVVATLRVAQGCRKQKGLPPREIKPTLYPLYRDLLATAQTCEEVEDRPTELQPGVPQHAQHQHQHQHQHQQPQQPLTSDPVPCNRESYELEEWERRLVNPTSRSTVTTVATPHNTLRSQSPGPCLPTAIRTTQPERKPEEQPVVRAHPSQASAPVRAPVSAPVPAPLPVPAPVSVPVPSPTSAPAPYQTNPYVKEMVLKAACAAVDGGARGSPEELAQLFFNGASPDTNARVLLDRLAGRSVAASAVSAPAAPKPCAERPGDLSPEKASPRQPHPVFDSLEKASVAGIASRESETLGERLLDFYCGLNAEDQHLFAEHVKELRDKKVRGAAQASSPATTNAVYNGPDVQRSISPRRVRYPYL